ncbi:hypothetical protein G3I23_27915, partial [Streptomyces sp. SID10115]|uniref:hypothetical protein n=2 Tax=unclassified Streptomyces TaxID=2593676 RepID=UPI0013C8FA85
RMVPGAALYAAALGSLYAVTLDGRALLTGVLLTRVLLTGVLLTRDAVGRGGRQREDASVVRLFGGGTFLGGGQRTPGTPSRGLPRALVLPRTG